MKFSELVRLLEQDGFRLIKEKGSIRYYAKTGHPHLIRVDFQGSKEVPTRMCYGVLHFKTRANADKESVSCPAGGSLLVIGRKPLKPS